MNAREQAAYTRGFVNGLYSSGMLAADESKLKSLQTCLIGMNDTQIRAVIEKHIKNGPEQWHRPLNELSMVAIGRVCDLFPKQ